MPSTSVSPGSGQLCGPRVIPEEPAAGSASDSGSGIRGARYAHPGV